jgi:hypothetical protein
VAKIDRSVEIVRKQPRLDVATHVEPLVRLREDVSRGATSNTEFVSALLDRHEKVQRAKRKGVWIDRTTHLTLMPGFGVGGDAPPVYERTFRHPFRVVNAYAFLDRLNRTSVESVDVEA